MRLRWPPAFPSLLAVLQLAAAGCGGGPSEAVPAAPVDVTGSYQVRGITEEIDRDARRDIGGVLILAQRGDEYTASFHLTTTLPSPDGFLPAEVVGSGSGVIEGRQLRGRAETQLILGVVPGEAGSFPLAPRVYGPRLVSQSSGRVDPDGTLRFSTDNRAAAGETYAPTRTTLTGVRVEPP